MQKIQTNKMAVKPIVPLLMTMALPPMISMMIQSLYNIIDSMFVAQVSQEALTAVSLAFPIQSLIISCSVGIGVGANSYISRKLGEHDFKEANSTVLHGLILAGVGALLFMIIGMIGIQPFFQLFSNDPIILEDAYAYTYIVVLFCFTSFFHILIEKVFQSTGKMIFPMAIQAIGAITNIILDPIFIFGFMGIPAMGVKGAAIATVIGQLLAMSLSFYVLLCKKHDVKVDISSFVFHKATILKILMIGIPNAMMNALGSFLVMGLNSLLVNFSNTAVSVYGVYYKLQTFVFMPASGLTQGAMPIMGYNYGAGNRKRLLETLKVSIFVTFIIMCCGMALFMLFPTMLLAMFNATPDLMDMGTIALRTISISYLPASLGFILPTLFQAMGKGAESLLVFLLRQFAITLPLSYILSTWIGIEGIWMSFIIAESMAALVAVLLFIRIYKKDPILSNQEEG